ncbi:CvfB family protein [Paenibacillus turpanensis]|uniref:CvfB family protein n=1 Tax=Paenibacillus turpanensis TaxID=2689078 RepID=UPI00140CF264|nr:S1-like domain-containing RNA-binding protein [Paenibacillus turpanensis]
MTLEAGITVTLTVDREVSPYGFFVTDGDREVLLHYNEIEGSIKVGDQVEVFLYHDTNDRPAATMRKPFLQYGETGLLEVADIHPKMGCFLEFGLGRQLLLPANTLPELPALHPQVGDRVYVTVDRDKQGRLLAKPAREEELAPLCVRAPATWKNRTVEAIVYKSLQMGSFVVCDAGVLGYGVLGFIHERERTRQLRVGEKVEVRVSFVREEDGRVNLTMRPLKQVAHTEDADRIYAFLSERPNGAMPYSDETPADVILKRFGISKSAFKRALGKLMRDGLAVQRGSWTYMKGSEPEEGAGDHAAAATSGETGSAEDSRP